MRTRSVLKVRLDIYHNCFKGNNLALCRFCDLESFDNLSSQDVSLTGRSGTMIMPESEDFARFLKTQEWEVRNVMVAHSNEFVRSIFSLAAIDATSKTRSNTSCLLRSSMIVNNRATYLHKVITFY